MTHIGGPTVLVEVGEWRLLTDPTFDPPGRRYSFGWGTGSRKRTGPSLDPAELGPVDAVLLSHEHHADNLDDRGRELLAGVPVVVTTRAGARRLGGPGSAGSAGDVRGLLPWEETVLEAPGRPRIRVTATPCRHGPPLSRPIVGPVVGFALGWDGQEHGVLWMTGDTVLFPALRAVPRRMTVDTVLLHLGAVRFPLTGPVHYSLTAAQAVELCGLVQPRTIVPVHYEGWEHFSQGREAVERAFAGAPDGLGDRLHWLPLSPRPSDT
ncbi:MBL fold metallo-hydrolase [Dactylosporangium sp. NPDC005572]|uniref:MBL fold metallo-hydrolase n=1 Tax=Dactylosporangium sp. NPDC005572 TaxID=3156889 RepID=UPI0033BEC729